MTIQSVYHFILLFIQKFCVPNIQQFYYIYTIEELEIVKQMINLAYRNSRIIPIYHQFNEQPEQIFLLADGALKIINKTIDINIELIQTVLLIIKNKVYNQFKMISRIRKLESLKSIEQSKFKEQKSIYLNFKQKKEEYCCNLMIRFYLRLSEKLFTKFHLYNNNKNNLKFISFNYVKLQEFHNQLNKFDNIQNFVFFSQITTFIQNQNNILFDFILQLIVNKDYVTSVQQYYGYQNINNHKSSNPSFTNFQNKTLDKPDSQQSYLINEIIMKSQDKIKNVKPKKSVDQIINFFLINISKKNLGIHKVDISQRSIKENKINEKSQSSEIKELEKVKKQLSRISRSLKDKYQFKTNQQNIQMNANKNLYKKNQSTQIDNKQLHLNETKFNFEQNKENLQMINEESQVINNIKNDEQKINFSKKSKKALLLQKNNKFNWIKNRLIQHQNITKKKSQLQNKNKFYLSTPKNLFVKSKSNYSLHSNNHKLVFDKYKQQLNIYLPFLEPQQHAITLNNSPQRKQSMMGNKSCWISSGQSTIIHQSIRSKNNPSIKQKTNKKYYIYNPKSFNIFS